MPLRLRKPFRLRGSIGDAQLQGVVMSTSLTTRQLTSLVLGMVFAASLIIVLGAGHPPLPYRRGQVAGSDIRARVTFSIVDEEQTKKAREDAALAAPSVYRADTGAFSRAIDGLKLCLPQITGSQTFEDIPSAVAESLGITRQLYEAVKAAPPEVSTDATLAAAAAAFDAVTRKGCLSDTDLKLEQGRTQAGGISIVAGAERRLQPFGALLRPEQLKSAFRTEVAGRLGSPELADAIVANVEASLKPFLFYDDTGTKEARDAAAAAAPQVTHVFDRGDILVRRDSLIDRLQVLLLEKEQEVYLHTMPRRDLLARLVGMAITVSFMVWLFGSYVSQYEPRVLEKRTRIIILMALAVGLVAVTRFFVRSTLSWHLIPMSLFAMAVAIAYNALFAVGYTLFLAVLVGIMTGGDFALAVSLFLGSTMGVLSIGRVRSRTAPIFAGLSAGIGTFVATWGTGLLFHADYDYTLTLSDSAFGLLNGLACGAVITVLLPFIERAFKVVTELSLLEIADLNKPMLRRLALEAPGSYNHSLMVGTMAGAACESIGANALLAKAGGYYHDIGKLTKPDYFVENRTGALSRHYNLSPTMSALIIIAHVKDGVEMARECELPPPLVEIIREHHGTTLVEYFYREAIEQAGDEKEVSDQTFRYPGPKPHTKEAAAIMLADSIESASRTVADPSPAKLESLVRDIAAAKLEDGQFEECGLTMAELKGVELSLTKSLAGVFHARVKYPGQQQ